MYVCMRACVHAYVCMYVCMYVCVCMYVYVLCMYVCMYVLADSQHYVVDYFSKIDSANGIKLPSAKIEWREKKQRWYSKKSKEAVLALFQNKK